MSIEQLPQEKQQLLKEKIELVNEQQNKDPRYKFREQLVSFNYMIPSQRQRMMLFEKIKYLVDVRKVEMDKLIPSSSSKIKPDNQHYQKYLNHHKIKFLHNELIHLIRNSYEKIYQKE